MCKPFSTTDTRAARKLSLPMLKPKHARDPVNLAEILFHKGNTVDLFKRGLAGKHLRQRGLPQRSHAFGYRRRLQFADWIARYDHLPYTRGQREKLGNRGASTVAGAAAMTTAFSLIPNLTGMLPRV